VLAIKFGFQAWSDFEMRK